MERKEAKDILLKFAEENKYKSDWNGFLAGAISTYLKLEPVDEEKLDELAREYYKQSFHYIDVDAGIDITYHKISAYKAGYRKAMED